MDKEIYALEERMRRLEKINSLAVEHEEKLNRRLLMLEVDSMMLKHRLKTNNKYFGINVVLWIIIFLLFSIQILCYFL